MTTSTPSVAAQTSTAGMQDPIKLPQPEVELPELPFDKSQLPEVQKLDTRIRDAAHLAAAVELFDGMFQELKTASNASLNGTNKDQVRGIMQIVDGFAAFEASARPIAELARKRFVAKYGDDDKFAVGYRELYLAAEEDLHRAIKDNVVRRATGAAMNNTYRNVPRSNVSYLDRMLEESLQLREQAIGRVVSSAGTDMMVADYKKGQVLVDLLQGTKSKLVLIQQLDKSSSAIDAVMKQVDEKVASRSEEIAKARAEYRFPQRYDGQSVPENAAELEASLRERLTKSGYDVKAVAVASAWIAVRSPLGIHLYNQIDFYVAVVSHVAEEAKADVLDVMYVTGKTGGPELQVPFAKHSAGVLAQMLGANL